MTPLEQAPLIVSFGKKILTFHNGALVVMAAPGSITLAGLIDQLIADTPLKDLVLPIVVAGVGLGLYFIIFMLDFFSGVKASKFEAKLNNETDYFKSSKGWSSIWKIATVSTLVVWSSFFSILAALGNIPYFPGFFMLASGTIAIMASLLDIYSIGENQKRTTGKKAAIFLWFEKMYNLIDEGIMKRVKGIFKI